MLALFPDLVIAFHKDIDKSRDTIDMLRKAHDAGVKVRLWTGREVVVPPSLSGGVNGAQNAAYQRQPKNAYARAVQAIDRFTARTQRSDARTCV
jgi:hypothetical protein